ncbi:MAG: hypothetical protein A2W91_19875 [Bacteroidetes bacterium GWF2_38_335]|nr:MAG: hypothetical protein A2W91_19875 [Bacteroidetes bacterium GWF2_38_335]OFY82019.1 MAG: hypothetical protein A2281_10045 [Bacteroidetes bacterium RIFOXYA12_FULL_38_20]HBS86478.1 hypothetical protein [Bacteroidales bacterium]
MNKLTLKEITDFTSAKNIAVAGASRNKKKFGSQVYRSLKEKGYQLLPVHPEAADIEGDKCVKSVADIPAEFTHLLVITKKQYTDAIVDQAMAKGIKNLWLQQECATKETIEKAKSAGINVVNGECIFMHTQPKGIHNFHKSIRKFFGSFPK